MSTVHVGFSGTRHGTTDDQFATLHRVFGEFAAERRILNEVMGLPPPNFVAHHGCCIGGDEEFHGIVRSHSGVVVVGHPGPGWPDSNLCARVECDRTHKPDAHMKRNQAIVDWSNVMFAAPPADEPQAYGGTWATIRMAMRALRSKKLAALHVIGRTGLVLDHTRWEP